MDTVIVGQGLAGSILAWTLIQAGQNILVFDDPSACKASAVAGGLFNPLTGPRLVLPETIAEVLHSAMALYRQLESSFKGRLFTSKPLWRIFRSARDRQRWESCQQQPAYQDYLGPGFDPQGLDGFYCPWGGGIQKQTGFLDMPQLLDWVHRFLAEQNVLIEKPLNADSVHPASNHVMVDGVKAGHIIFCDGAGAVHNPWFAWLPFQAAKGEILDLRTLADDLPDAIVVAGHWLLPLGDGMFRLGATYQWDGMDAVVTEAARKRLLQALHSFYHGAEHCRVVNHRAGIRPCTRDTQPFIGMHPRWHRLGLFNGFGSKGGLWVPYAAQCFAEFLLRGQPLPEAWHLARYQSLLQS